MGACQSNATVQASTPASSKAPTPKGLKSTVLVEDSDVGQKPLLVLSPATVETEKDDEKEGTDAVGLKDLTNTMKARGGLNETYVRMETPIGVPIEDVYNGVHDGRVLGSGVSGVVRVVEQKATGVKFAAKSIDLGLVQSKEALAQLRNEISILCQVDHPNIVRLDEVYESESEIYLVQELCLGGELFDRLDEQSDYHYTENQCARLVKQMLSSLVYLHSKAIIHRDLKLENFLFSSRKPGSELKLIDFGLSKHIQCGEEQHESVGTPYTVAPEVISGSYDERSDLWAIGVITYLLLSGETPFGGCDGENLMEVRENILQGSFAFEPEDTWEGVSELAKDFIRRLLVVDYRQRPSAKDIIRHEWIERVNAYDISDSMHGSGLNPNVVRALVSFKEYSDMRKLLLEILSFTLLPDQIIELREDFEKLDANGDGEVSLEEFKGMLLENAEAGCLGALTNEEVEQIFDAMRVRKTETTIRWHEFIAAGLSQCKIDERNLRLAFNRLDIERKGYITFENIMDLVCSNGDRDELHEIWLSSIQNESLIYDTERIYYDDFVLLMKGQTKQETVQSKQFFSTRFIGDNAAKQRAKSLSHTPRPMNFDNEEQFSILRSPMLASDSSRAVVLPGRQGSVRKVDRIIEDETMTPLAANKTLYRSNREMRLAVLEASKRFEEKQTQRSKEPKKAGLVMKRSSCPSEQDLLTTAKRRSGRGRTRRYRTCSDLTGMVMVQD